MLYSDKLEKCYNNLGELFNSLSDKEKYACPYLVVPNKNSEDSRHNILLCGKETNGWGESEGYRNDLISNPKDWENIKIKLLELYDRKVNLEWGKNIGGPFWSFYRMIREFFEKNPYNENLNPQFASCSLTVGNISLLGYNYGSKGFNPSLIDFQKNNHNIGLATDFEYLAEALNPDLLIATVGYKKSNYTQILEKVFKISYSDFSFFEILIDKDNHFRIVETDKEQIVKKNMNRDFCFGILKLKSLTIILAPHPERKSKIKLLAFKKYILSLLSSL